MKEISQHAETACICNDSFIFDPCFVVQVKAGVFLVYVQFKDMRNHSVQLQWKSSLPDPVAGGGLGSIPSEL